jgi:hypothetical protein
LGFLWIRLGNMLFGGLAVVAEAVLRDRTYGVWAFASI